jgi:nucleoid-associated protein YgaU
VATHPAARGSELYRIRRGDTLVKIAAAHGTTWRTLYNANRRTVTDPALIITGHRLVMP